MTVLWLGLGLTLLFFLRLGRDQFGKALLVFLGEQTTNEGSRELFLHLLLFLLFLSLFLLEIIRLCGWSSLLAKEITHCEYYLHSLHFLLTLHRLLL